jgi:hypothetical protein
MDKSEKEKLSQTYKREIRTNIQKRNWNKHAKEKKTKTIRQRKN